MPIWARPGTSLVPGSRVTRGDSRLFLIVRTKRPTTESSQAVLRPTNVHEGRQEGRAESAAPPPAGQEAPLAGQRKGPCTQGQGALPHSPTTVQHTRTSNKTKHTLCSPHSYTRPTCRQTLLPAHAQAAHGCARRQCKMQQLAVVGISKSASHETML